MLQGFTQEAGFRIFRFQGIAADHSRLPFLVRAEVAVAQRYGIPLQELPLLCRAVLERRPPESRLDSFTYTEEEMAGLARERRTARENAVRRRKPPRRPEASTLGDSWRTPPRTS